ncbi:hypothetical protein IF1G_06906 [Cordyceps javanica]|uniref:Uncharacterized protein n=1 Tax=Cordyceps javanica TaxID=43265 RepID=A0A545UX31_9HYPO|nr:hypothetical protein IF1G_06906 [Cordyceps javanica]
MPPNHGTDTSKRTSASGQATGLGDLFFSRLSDKTPGSHGLMLHRAASVLITCLHQRSSAERVHGVAQPDESVRVSVMPPGQLAYSDDPVARSLRGKVESATRCSTDEHVHPIPRWTSPNEHPNIEYHLGVVRNAIWRLSPILVTSKQWAERCFVLYDNVIPSARDASVKSRHVSCNLRVGVSTLAAAKHGIDLTMLHLTMSSNHQLAGALIRIARGPSGAHPCQLVAAYRGWLAHDARP